MKSGIPTSLWLELLDHNLLFMSIPYLKYLQHVKMILPWDASGGQGG
jgi:hypothetical protein